MNEQRERVTFWGLVAALLATTAAAYALVLGPEPGAGPVLAATGTGAVAVREAAGGQLAVAGAQVGVAVRPELAAPSGGAPPSAGDAGPLAASAGAPGPGGMAPDAAPGALAVATVAGEVTLVRGGVASPAQPGDPVRPGDALVTGVGARVVLAGGACALALEEGGRVEVKESTPARMRLRLDTGLVLANVRGARRSVEIEAAVDAVARTSGGALSVARSGRLVAAAVRAGTAEVRAAGAAVSLEDGERAAVLDGRAPEPPMPIPASVALEVAWPDVGRRGRTKEPRVTVRGETDPGAIVFVAEQRVEVGADGRFVHEIALSEGYQRLTARALAAGDLRAAVRGPGAILDTTAPEPKFDTRGLWTRQ